jgi:hypothetical protein
LLGDDVRYVLSGAQVPSTIVAEQQSSDFPCTFDFRVTFDAYLGGLLVFPRHHGRPKGHGFGSVPPDGDPCNSPTITEFETQQIVVEHPTLGPVRFTPKDCNDSASQTVAVPDEERAVARKLMVAPIPATGPVTISFELPVARSAWLHIVDVGGRVVRRLDLNGLGAGRHGVTWDAQDGNGRPVPAGVYGAKLFVDGRSIGRARFVISR